VCEEKAKTLVELVGLVGGALAQLIGLVGGASALVELVGLVRTVALVELVGLIATSLIQLVGLIASFALRTSWWSAVTAREWFLVGLVGLVVEGSLSLALKFSAVTARG